MTSEINVITKTSEIDPRRWPPDSELLKQIKDRFASNADKSTNLLLRSPDSILQPMNRAQKYLQKLPFAPACAGRPNKALWHFINYLVQYGALIMTDDPTQRYFFDAEQLDIIGEAGRRREVPTVKYAPEERLHSFLRGETKQKSRRLLTAAEIKTLICAGAFDFLKPLCEDHPETERIVEQISALAAACVTADAQQIEETAGHVFMALDDSVRKIASRVESQALELLMPDRSVAVKVKPTPTAADDLPTRLTALAAEAGTLQTQIDKLRREQALVESWLDDVNQRVLEQDLKPRLHFVEAEDLKKIELAIERAHAKADELKEHIDQLLGLQAPLENRVRELQRLQNALKICAAAKRAEVVSEKAAAIPARPDYDPAVLLHWQNIDLSDEMETTVITDLTGFSAEEKLLIAAFQVIERKTSTGKMAHALVALGLSGERSEKELRHVCRALSEREPPPIRYVGSVARAAIYMHSDAVVIGNVNAIIPENKQAELLAMFHKATANVAVETDNESEIGKRKPEIGVDE